MKANFRTITSLLQMRSLAIVALLAAAGQVWPQAPGDLDSSFDPGWHADGPIAAIVVQADGKVLVGSETTGVGRFQADGRVDSEFKPAAGTYGIRSIALEPDGKVLIAGEFPLANGAVLKGIARLNADGTLDSSFEPPSLIHDTMQFRVYSVVRQADGKLLIGGLFTQVNGASRNGIARLNPDGSLDQTFVPAIDPSGVPSNERSVFCLAVQPDGKVLAGSSGGIRRLNPDGTQDTSFTPPPTPPGQKISVRAIVLQPDGKVLAGGLVVFMSSAFRGYLARLNPDGSADSTFDPGTGPRAPEPVPGYPVAGYGTVRCLALQPDGKVLLGGEFTTFNGTPRNRLARLNADGSLDSSFDPGTGPADGSVSSIALQPDGKALVGGDFSSFRGTDTGGLARLNADGSVDSSFDPAGSGVDNAVFSVLPQSDGAVLIGGAFTRIGAVGQSGIARLKTDGHLDDAFDPGTGVRAEPPLEYHSVRAFALQPNGKVLIGGRFSHFNGVARGGIARLNANGSLDAGFDPGQGIGGSQPEVWAIALQADGKVLVAGAFTSFNGVPVGRIVRLNTDGSLDSSFNPGTGPTDTLHWYGPVILALALQPDGRVLISGRFSRFNGTERNAFARLNPDGSLDTSFNPSIANPGAEWVLGVSDIALQPDGKILIGGSFSQVNGANRKSIARLTGDGLLDSSFDAGTTAGGISSLALQPDGKVLIAGEFAEPGGTGSEHIVVRLNADGTRDQSFDPGAGANGDISVVALQADGEVLIGGGFTSLDGIRRLRVARLHGGEEPGALRITAVERLSSGTVRCTVFGEPGRTYTLQTSSDLITWADLDTLVPATSHFAFTDATAEAPRRFYRVKTP